MPKLFAAENYIADKVLGLLFWSPPFFIFLRLLDRLKTENGKKEVAVLSLTHGLVVFILFLYHLASFKKFFF
jgi:hypothetical protein